jgi:Chaperone of endosialidase
LGRFAGATVSTATGVIAIGDIGGNVNLSTWIGNVYGVTTQSGTTLPVVVSDGHQLGTVNSSRRFKKDIEAMNKTSEAILALKPVTFHYKSDKTNTSQFGLVAEEVAEVNPDLVVRDKDGEIYTVRYDAVNAMLLNEFLKEHRKLQEQEATIVQLRSTVTRQEASGVEQQKEIKALAANLKEQAMQLQKVSAQIEVRKFATGRIRRGGPAPRTVLNKP